MDAKEPRFTDEQKRMGLVLLVIIGVIAIVSILIGSLIASLGVPLWIAVVVTLIVAGAVGLFMFLNLA